MNRISRITILIMALLALLPQGIDARIRWVGMGKGHDSIPYSQIKNKGLMIVDIHTNRNEWPRCDYVYAPIDGWGKSITNVTRVPGRLIITDGDNKLYDSGEYVEESSGMTLSLRGNSSAFYPKKPYKIRLQSKADLLCRNNANYRDKQFILICDEELKAFQGFELSRLLGMTWVPGYRYVNLIINDEYCGVYMLTENVRRNTNCRLNVKKDGFIFECDAYWWNEDYYIPSLIDTHLNFTFKYPEPEELTDAQKAYMTQLLNAYEYSLWDGTYPDYIDVPSFARWCLGQDILATRDAAGVNRYYTKYDATSSSKLVMPMMWDFDSAEGDTTNWSVVHQMFMFPLFESSNRTFVNEYVAQWEAVAPILYTSMYNVINNFKSTQQGQGIMASMPLNNTRWDSNYPTYSFFYFRAQWFKTRFDWLNRNILALIPRGDVNLDGVVDVSDVNIIINKILKGDQSDKRHADLNGDDNIDVSDVNEVINIILTSNPHTPDDPVDPDDPDNPGDR